MKTAKELIKILRTTDESSTIEAKECGRKIDRSVMETICAFANEPDLGGGYILLGLHVDDTKIGTNRYTIVGVENPDKLQNDIVTQCSNVFNRRIIVHTDCQYVEDKPVIIIFVPEGEPSMKPFYFEKQGFPKGGYRRISGTDQQCNEEDVPILCSKSDDFDKGIIEDATIEDIDENALRRYRELRAKVNPNAEELTYNDNDLLQSIGCLKRNKTGEFRLTNTGLLVFGKASALRRIYPMVRTDYIRVPGNEWVENPDERFETIDMRSPLILLVNRLYNAIVDDLPRQFELKEGKTQATSKIKIPEKVLREAIVNALIHRSYRVNRPIQVIRYSNRIEILNPGYSLKPEDSLGEPGSALRNPLISAIFHETDLAETKGSGMKSMRVLMNKAKILPPTYESNHSSNTFTLRILLHQLLGAEDLQWLNNFESPKLTQSQTIGLIFLHEVGAIDLLTYRQLTGLKNTSAKSDLGKMVNLALITSKGKGNKAYYLPSEETKSLFSKGRTSDGKKAEPQSSKGRTSDGKKAEPQSSKGRTSDGKKAEPQSSKGRTSELVKRILQEPKYKELKEKIESLKKKEPISKLKDFVEQLCSILPLSIEEIAEIIKRKEHYTWREIVKPLKKDGKLAFTHQEMANHPDQKYKIGFKSSYYKESAQ